MIELKYILYFSRDAPVLEKKILHRGFSHSECENSFSSSQTTSFQEFAHGAIAGQKKILTPVSLGIMEGSQVSSPKGVKNYLICIPWFSKNGHQKGISFSTFICFVENMILCIFAPVYVKPESSVLVVFTNYRPFLSHLRERVGFEGINFFVKERALSRFLLLQLVLKTQSYESRPFFEPGYFFKVLFQYISPIRKFFILSTDSQSSRASTLLFAWVPESYQNCSRCY